VTAITDSDLRLHDIRIEFPFARSWRGEGCGTAGPNP